MTAGHPFTAAEGKATCAACGLVARAHGQLAPHPEEAELRSIEASAASTLIARAGKAARAIREHRRIDAAVELTALLIQAENLRRGMVRAVEDQMQATAREAEEQTRP